VARRSMATVAWAELDRVAGGDGAMEERGEHTTAAATETEGAKRAEKEKNEAAEWLGQVHAAVREAEEAVEAKDAEYHKAASGMLRESTEENSATQAELKARWDQGNLASEDAKKALEKAKKALEKEMKAGGAHAKAILEKQYVACWSCAKGRGAGYWGGGACAVWRTRGLWR
jgi:hypothetical protein